MATGSPRGNKVLYGPWVSLHLWPPPTKSCRAGASLQDGPQPTGDVSRVLTRGPSAWHSEQKATVKQLPQSAWDTWSHPGWLWGARLADAGVQPSVELPTVPQTQPPQNTTATSWRGDEGALTKARAPPPYYPCSRWERVCTLHNGLEICCHSHT